MKALPLILNLTCVAALIAASGCASIITSGDRTIPVSSNPEAAKVTIYDANNLVVATGVTPTKIKLKKGAGYFKGADYRLVVEKDGYQPREFQIKHSLNGWYFGNFLFGGMLGLLVVDPLTGGMWALKPDQIDAQFVSTASAAARVDEPRLVVLTTDQIPAAQRRLMVPLTASGAGPAHASRTP